MSRSGSSQRLRNKAYTLQASAYTLSNVFPKEDFYGLTLRARHLSSAIIGYIREGTGSPSERAGALKKVVHHVAELKKTAKLSGKLNYITDEELLTFNAHCDKLSGFTRKMIFTLTNK